MMRIIKLLVLLLVISGCSDNTVQEGETSEYGKLKEGFINPPLKAHPKVYWWWLNGNTDTLRLKEELGLMKNAGISGFDIFEIGVPREDYMVKPGPAFLSNESLASIKLVIEEAGKLGMEAGLNMASSWNAGGSWIKPQHAAKSIYFSKTRFPGNTRIIKLPFPDILKKDARGNPRFIPYTPDGKPQYFKEIAVLAVPSYYPAGQLDTVNIIHLTSHFNPVTEELNWEPPGGEWDIFRYVCSNSGEQLKLPSKNSAGPIIDHFDSTATEAHFNYVIEKVKSVIPDLHNSALKSLYLASYEATGFVWTPSLPDEFRRINGYDIYKYLPVLFDAQAFNEENVEKFRSDFRRTLSELMIRNFYSKAREIANKNGLKINSEAGGPGLPLHNVPVEPLKALGSLDLPRGEFWINHNRLNAQGIDIMRVVKEVSAASHIYNRGIVEEESFTTFQHWQEGPVDMKPVGDRAFCEGMNRVVVHGFSHNPAGTGNPGYVYHAGTHFNDKRIWWPMIRPFNEYLARISFILQETGFVADVLYYYGDEIPNYTGHKNSRFTVAPGYDYEVINTEILKQLSVADNFMVLPGGARFRLLCLENEGEINSDVLIKLSELAGQGALILGAKPGKITRVAKNDDQSTYQTIIDELWVDFQKPGSGQNIPISKILSGITPAQMLELIKTGPDFTYTDSNLYLLDYIHYSGKDIHYYFVRNSTGRWISRNCSFRQVNKVPEIWDPVSGDIRQALIYTQEKEYTSLPLTLSPFGSCFIVFRDGNPLSHFDNISGKGSHPPLMNFSREGITIFDEGVFKISSGRNSKTINNNLKIQVLDGAWELYFPSGQGAPERIIFPELVSWTESDIPSVKYFSGIVKYNKTFQYDINSLYGQGYRVFLDLGDLSKVGDAWLNGKHLGIVWTKPFRFDVTEILKNGDNTLSIEIANTWSNRLTGDAQTGQKITNTNIKTTNIQGLNKIQVPWTDVPLIRSGLFGPVALITCPVITPETKKF